jgi:molecular chaperone GrpE (heat shock protein)
MSQNNNTDDQIIDQDSTLDNQQDDLDSDNGVQTNEVFIDQSENNENSDLDQNSDFDQETGSDSSSQTDADEDEISKLQAQIKILEIERDDWKDKAYRATADFRNFENQTVLTIESEKKSTKKQVLNQLASFINTLNISFAFAPQSDEESINQFVSALSGSFEKLINDLKMIGIEVLVPKVGEKIDTEYMVVLNDPNTSEDLKIKQVVSVGFRVDGQLVNPASVMV